MSRFFDTPQQVRSIRKSHLYGMDGFSYTISDGQAGDLASVTLTVTPVNDAPVATIDSYETTDGATVSTVSVLENDSDVDGDSLTAVLVTWPMHGYLEMSPDGQFTYVADSDYDGPDTFSYQAFDGTDYSATAVVSISPAGEPQAGILIANIVSGDAFEGSTIVIEGSLLTEASYLPAEIVIRDAETGSSLGVASTDVSGAFTFEYVVVDDNPTGSPIDVMTFEISTELSGAVISTQVSSNIANSPPEIEIQLVDPSAPTSEITTIPNGGAVELVIRISSDLGLNDSHRALVDWGDGTSPQWSEIEELEDGVKTLRIPKQFNTEPLDAPTKEYKISVTAQDDDGGEAKLTTGLTMLLAAAPDLPVLSLSATDDVADELPFLDDTATFVLSRTGGQQAVTAMIRSNPYFHSDYYVYVDGERISAGGAGYRIRIPELAPSVTITIRARVDNVKDPDEEFELSLVADTKYTISSDSADHFTITDSYGKATIHTSIGAVLEDANRSMWGTDLGRANYATAVITVYGKQASPANILRFNGVSDYGVDYTISHRGFDTNGTPGSYVYNYTVFVYPVADPKAEGDEAVEISLRESVLDGITLVPDRSTADIVIREDDTYSLSITPSAASAGETDRPTITIARHGGSNKWEVYLRLEVFGSAVNGVDYRFGSSGQEVVSGVLPEHIVAQFGNLTSIVLREGQSSVAYRVTPKADNLPEVDEDIAFHVFASSVQDCYSPANATITIIDLDRPDQRWVPEGDAPKLPTPNYPIIVVNGEQREWYYSAEQFEWVRIKVEYYWVALTADPIVKGEHFTTDDISTYYLETSSSNSIGTEGKLWGECRAIECWQSGSIVA